MSIFDEYVMRITAGLDLPDAARERIREEALSHLEDEAASLVRAGKTRDEAEALAVEAFGKDDAIAALVSQALARRQERHRRVRMALTVTGTFLPIIFVIGFGVWFSVFDDAVSGDAFVSRLPRYLFPILYFGAGVWGLAVLAGIAYRLSGVGKWPLIAAAFAVLAAFFLAAIAFDLSPLRDSYGYITGKETPAEMAANGFVMRAWLTLVPTCIVGIVGLVLGGDRSRTARLLAFALLTGLLGAALRGASLLNATARGASYTWLTPYKWPKLMSAGLFALAFVILVVLLARSIEARRNRKPRESHIAPPSAEATPN